MDRIAMSYTAFVCRALLLGLLLGLALWSNAGGAAQAQERLPHVLLLYPYDNTHAASTIAGEAVRKRLVVMPGVEAATVVKQMQGAMAYAVMGGLVVATLLTLVFLPALYVTWFRIEPVRPEQVPDAEVRNRMLAA